MKNKIELVKSELKELKSLANRVKLALNSQDTFLKLQKEIFKSKKLSDKQRSKLCEKWSKTSLKTAIGKYIDLAFKYNRLTADFSRLDQTVFYEAYINGTSITAIAKQFYYSYEAVRKRLKKIKCLLADKYVS